MMPVEERYRSDIAAATSTAAITPLHGTETQVTEQITAHRT
jgi:hypothetical protein